MVVGGFSALPAKFPELAGWVDNIRELYVEGAFPAVLSDSRSYDGRLLHFEDDNLVFSRAFFDADPIAQETALLDFVLAFHHGDPRASARVHAPEVAVKGEE